MTKSIDTHADNEIDLRQIITSLWRGKIFIIFCTTVSIAFASYNLRHEEKRYSIIHKLKPVNQKENGPNLSGLGGIASLAGINLPSSTSSDFNVFKELIYSTEVSQKIIENEDLTRMLFAGEWSQDLGKYSAGKKSKISELKNYVKKLILGEEEEKYIPPNSRRLARFISEYVKITVERKTGFLSLTSEHSQPELILKLLIEISNISDGIIRDRYVNFSKEPLEFYKEKLNSSRSREHREALAQLISKEQQKLMLASSSKYFAVEPITKPVISLYPTHPRPLSSLIISFFIGLVSSILIVLLRNKMLKDSIK
jgi:uncharacterized protein involved in exopolysaccharide biosynthesis